MASSSRIFFDRDDQTGKLTLLSVKAGEQLGRPCRFDVLIMRESSELTPRTVPGKHFGAEVLAADGSYRRFNGIAIGMSCGTPSRMRHEYRFAIEPDASLLSRRTDARIFIMEGLPAARVDDLTAHGGSIVSGAMTVQIGG